MTIENPKGIIELGNIYLKCIIYQINKNNIPEVLSSSITQSEGIHNGVIINIAKASNAIRMCIASAEKNAKQLIKNINVIIEQPEFLCTKFSKHRKINGSMIHKDDISFLLKEAKKQVTLNDSNQSIIHIFNHNYIVDGKKFAEEPIDVFADLLSHEMTFITMSKNNIKNINQAFINCDVEIDRFLSCTFTLAAKLLDYDELQFGSVLIDIGHEKTSLGIFKNLAPVHSVTFPIGINHIIKDLSKVCSINLEDSKNIIKKINFLFENNKDFFDEGNYLKNSFLNNSSFKKISKSLLFSVIKTRIDEIFAIINKQILINSSDSGSKNNILLVGGGSNLINVEKYASNFLDTNVKKINEIKNEGIDFKFASCLGALKIINDGWETEAIPEKVNRYSKKTSFFGKIFGIKS